MSATARWCGSSSRRCCAGSARCAICSRVCSNAGLPASAPQVESALLIGAAQILFLDVPDHAAVDLSVRLVQEDRHARHYSALVNAVLRRVARDGAARLAAIDPVALDTPEWLMRRWQAHYGDATARAIAAANAQEPALDLTVKDEPRQWAARLDGRVLPTGSVRVAAHGPVTRLAGFGDGAWWVQDAAAALPARLLGDVRGKSVADLCAAPGGKTAQLAAAGARVTAVDRSEPRLKRLRENLARLGLDAEHRPGRRHAMAGRAVRRRAGRRALLSPPAPSAAIPTSPGSRTKPSWRSSPRCRPGCSTAPPSW